VKLKDKIEELMRNYPQVRLLVSALAPELESILHPTGKPDPGNDIEVRLDESYKQILKDNKRSKVMQGIEKLLLDLLRHAAAKNGLKL